MQIFSRRALISFNFFYLVKRVKHLDSSFYLLTFVIVQRQLHCSVCLCKYSELISVHCSEL